MSIFHLLQPTVLPFAHLFNIDACASFVSDHICHFSLSDADANALSIPSAAPPTVRSPTHTLATQKGNCVEVANVLASLLCGFGYQAFVVVGRAKAEVANADRTGEKCPQILEEAEVYFFL